MLPVRVTLKTHRYFIPTERHFNIYTHIFKKIHTENFKVNRWKKVTCNQQA